MKLPSIRRLSLDLNGFVLEIAVLVLFVMFGMTRFFFRFFLGSLNLYR